MFVNRHPLQLFLILLIYVFISEMGVMFVLDNVKGIHQSPWLEAIVDGTLLTLLCVPFFWYAYMKPLQNLLQLEGIKSHKIVEMAAEGIISIDTKGMIRSFNRAAQRMFGYSEEETIGKNVALLMPSPHRENHDGYLARYVQTGQAHVIDKVRELQGQRKDGTTFPVELAVTEVELGETHFFTAILRDISEQKLAQQRIEELAHYDALTHLPNRRLFYDRFNQAILIAKRSQRGITLLYMDLDGFKKVNDTLGHHFGDMLLVKVAERLRLCVRESDTLARFGGDEFTLVLNETRKREDVAMVAKKIIEAIAHPFDLEGQEARIGVSIGIALYPDDAKVETELLIVADKAMYAAKAAGKNTYRFDVEADEAV
jgi:diguanylate cyclase (GGDEF)-like protein/PAS domain S-box-containing protein